MMRRFFLCLFLLALAPLGQAAVSYPVPLGVQARGIFPYFLVGQLTFTSGRTDYVASGSVIALHSVLTAGHNVYDPDTGFSTKLEFARGLYGRQVSPAPVLATRRYVFAQYQGAAVQYGPDDIRTFARDSAGLVFAKELAPRHMMYTPDVNYLHAPHLLLGVGYGAEGQHTGEVPLVIRPTTSFYHTYGNFVESRSIYVEGGMSGGPLFSTSPTGTLVQIGIIVSGSTEPVAGGVRLLDAPLISNIKTYLP